MPVPQELLCSFQEHCTCRAAEDLGLSKLLSPPASSVWGWDWIFTPSPLGYPGKAAALPVLQESCQGCCIRSGRPRFSCARLCSHCLLWAEPQLSPILPFPGHTGAVVPCIYRGCVLGGIEPLLWLLRRCFFLLSSRNCGWEGAWEAISKEYSHKMRTGGG